MIRDAMMPTKSASLDFSRSRVARLARKLVTLNSF